MKILYGGESNFVCMHGGQQNVCSATGGG